MEPKNIKVKIKPKFKVGDRVQAVCNISAIKNVKGTIKDISTGSFSGAMMYAVEFEKTDIFLHECQGRCSPNTGFWCFADQLMLIEAEQPKTDYTWHDLRKNPEDLPKKDGKYISCIIWGNYRSELLLEYSIAKQDWTTILSDRIVAWRDYEHFKP